MIKTVAFDFDGTIHSGLDFTPWRKYAKEAVKQIFVANNKQITFDIETIRTTDVAIVNLLFSHGIEAKQWIDHKMNHFDELRSRFDFSVVTTTDKEVLEEFFKNHTLYIISNSTRREIEATAKLLNIDLSIFKEIICNPFNGKDNTKRAMLQSVLKKEKIQPYEMLMIGDSQESDIEPAIALNIKAHLVKDSHFDYETVMNQVNSQHIKE